jgi:hypothetical protein
MVLFAGSQYFFEIFNVTANATQAHAAAATTFPATTGEVLWTKFDVKASVWTLSMVRDSATTPHASRICRSFSFFLFVHYSPPHILTLHTRIGLPAHVTHWPAHITHWPAQGVKGDSARVSTLVVPAPYMGLLPGEASSWAADSFNTTFVNSCWELYSDKVRVTHSLAHSLARSSSAVTH